MMCEMMLFPLPLARNQSPGAPATSAVARETALDLADVDD